MQSMILMKKTAKFSLDIDLPFFFTRAYFIGNASLKMVLCHQHELILIFSLDFHETKYSLFSNSPGVDFLDGMT